MSDVAAVRSSVRAAVLDREWLWFGVATAGVFAYYVALSAPVIDPPNYLDPWIYTASFVNFGWMYDAFGWTYYPSRLPWVMPGMAAHALFGPVTAFFVLHVLYFGVTGLFAYLLFRRFFGSRVALAAYLALMLSPLFYDAYSNDYPDGALLTYLFGAAYFAFSAEGARRPRLRTFWAGFFAAAAMGTNLFAGVVLVCFLLAYALVRLELVRDVRRLVRELAFGAAGAVVLLVLCGSFSIAYGGPFLFFKPQVNALHYIHASDYKQGGSSWVISEPQLLLPGFAVVAVLVLLRGRLVDLPRRLAIGGALATAVFYALIVVWEFGFGGNFLETVYYFSIFNLGIAICLAAAFFLLAPSRGVAAAVAVGAIAPTLLVFVHRVLPVARTGAVVVVALMTLCLVALAIAARSARLRSGGVAALLAGLTAFCATYAGDAGSATQSTFQRHTFSRNRDVQRMGFQLIDFMRDRGIQKVPFQFWYDGTHHPELNGIQSTYLWGDTWVGVDLPKLDSSTRALLDGRKPSVLVLLCTEPACANAPDVLAKAGYRLRRLARGVLHAGGRRVIVAPYALPDFAKINRNADRPPAFYAPAAAPVAAATKGTTVQRWSFAHGAPEDWSGDASDDSRAAAGRAFQTSTGRFAYELTGPELELGPGRYVAYARGRILSGGLDLGVLDDDAKTWIAQRLYWYGQRQQLAGGWMATPFTITKATKAKVILSNWRKASGASKWQLDEVRIARLP